MLEIEEIQRHRTTESIWNQHSPKFHQVLWQWDINIASFSAINLLSMITNDGMMYCMLSVFVETVASVVYQEVT